MSVPDLLAATRAALGPAKRPPPRGLTRLMAPAWLRTDDPLHVQHVAQERLVTEGALVLAFLVRPTEPPGARTLGTGVITAVYPHPADPPPTFERLLHVAERVRRLGDPEGELDPAVRRFAQRFEDDDHRHVGAEVPQRLAQGGRFFLSDLIVHAAHELPGSRLVAPFFPLLVHPTASCVRVLPSSLWAPDLARAFRLFAPLTG